MNSLSTSISRIARWLAKILGLTIDFSNEMSIDDIDLDAVADQLHFGRK